MLRDDKPEISNADGGSLVARTAQLELRSAFMMMHIEDVGVLAQ